MSECIPYELHKERMERAVEEIRQLRARVAELESVLRESGAWPVAEDDDAHDYLECRWCMAHTHYPE